MRSSGLHQLNYSEDLGCYAGTPDADFAANRWTAPWCSDVVPLSNADTWCATWSCPRTVLTAQKQVYGTACTLMKYAPAEKDMCFIAAQAWMLVSKIWRSWHFITARTDWRQQCTSPLLCYVPAVVKAASSRGTSIETPPTLSNVTTCPAMQLILLRACDERVDYVQRWPTLFIWMVCHG